MGKPTDEQIKWTADTLDVDEDKIRGETSLQLRFEEKNATDRLAKPRSYKGREHDDALKAAIDDELARRDTVQAATQRLTNLIDDSDHELNDLAVNTDSLDRAINGEMIRDYLGLFEELRDMVAQGQESLKSGQALPENILSEWSDALHETGELRRVLTSNLGVQNDKSLKEAQARLSTSMEHLAKLMKSANVIAEEVKRVEDGEKWVSRLLWVNEKVEALRGVVSKVELAEKAIDAVAGLAKEKLEAYAGIKLELIHVGSTSDMIEAGVKNLGDYTIQLALVGEGFSSLKELQTGISSTTETIKNEGAELARLVDRKEALDQKYAVPTKGVGKK